MEKTIYCPTCQNKVYFCLDGYGRTPLHLHCNNCNINIGVSKSSKAKELLQKYHSPNTWIEYYNNAIQILNINGEYIINKTEV